MKITRLESREQEIMQRLRDRPKAWAIHLVCRQCGSPIVNWPKHKRWHKERENDRDSTGH